MTASVEPIVIYTTWPDADTADRAGRDLVTRNLAACTNRLAPMVSIFAWNGKVQQESEVAMLIKTTRARLDDVIAALGDLHPYDVPAILALPVIGGNGPFIDWIAAETAPRPESAKEDRNG